MGTKSNRIFELLIVMILFFFFSFSYLFLNQNFPLNFVDQVIYRYEIQLVIIIIVK